MSLHQRSSRCRASKVTRLVGRRRVVQPLRLPEASPQPGPRAYHSLTAMGRYLVLFGGRCSGDLVHGKEKLAVFDAVTNCWTMLGGRIRWLCSRVHVLCAFTEHVQNMYVSTYMSPSCCCVLQVLLRRRARPSQAGAVIAASLSATD